MGQLFSSLFCFHHDEIKNDYILILENKPWYLKQVINKNDQKIVMKIGMVHTDPKMSWILKKNNSNQCIKSELLVLSKFPKSNNCLLVTHEWCYVDNSFYCLYECADMDLYSYIANSYSNVSMKVVLKQILKAILMLHKNHIIHNDIKFENFVVNLITNRIRLIDFEYCQEWNSPKKRFGTPSYMAPEIKLHNEITDYSPGKQDIWSFGMLYYFWTISQTEIVSKYFPATRQEYESLYFPNDEILKYCLCMDPHERLSIHNLIKKF